MEFGNLSSTQKDKLMACKTPSEILALAREEGFELSDSELASASNESSWSECGKDTNSGPY